MELELENICTCALTVEVLEGEAGWVKDTEEIKGKRVQLEALLKPKSELIVVQDFDLFVEEMKID
jgi:hypothetical protein